MTADLIIYGLVAAGLVFWLRSLLGTRHGEERERPPVVLHERSAERDEALAKTLPEAGIQSPEDSISELALNPTPVMSIADKTAENGLIDIAAKDKRFDVKFFLEAAQDAFVMIVEAFANGDRRALQDLLSENVYNAFEQAITEREKREETQKTEIHAIRKSDIIEASLKGRMGFITVRFIADETSVTRDSEDNIISGDPDRTTEMRDVWTFGRDLKSGDPRWLVFETRDDGEADNELIPNSKDA